jgi:hypothetical protein
LLIIIAQVQIDANIKMNITDFATKSEEEINDKIDKSGAELAIVVTCSELSNAIIFCKYFLVFINLKSLNFNLSSFFRIYTTHISYYRKHNIFAYS